LGSNQKRSGHYNAVSSSVTGGGAIVATRTGSTNGPSRDEIRPLASMSQQNRTAYARGLPPFCSDFRFRRKRNAFVDGLIALARPRPRRCGCRDQGLL